MNEFVIRNKFILTLLIIIFSYFNYRIINNFGFYNDDWTFISRLNFDSNFNEWAAVVWKGEAIDINRHISAPFYIILHLFNSKSIYIFSLILSLIIFFILFNLLNNLISENLKDIDKNELNLKIIILISAWYFFPFNIGGQFWITGIIHTKLSTLFLLLNLFFLIKNRFKTAIFFLICCFNVYEIYYFSYFFIAYIFYKGKLIEKKIFKKYFIFSTIIQIFFLIIKKRESYDINFLKIIQLAFENCLRFIWSIYTTVSINPDIFSISIFILICLTLVFFFYRNFILQENKNFLLLVLLCLIMSFGGNVLIHVIGTYGYWGKGIFSRTMFVPSLLLLILLIFFLSASNKKINLYISIFIFLLSCFFFKIEIKNWENSKILQDSIVKEYTVIKNKQFLAGNNLILFFGPCYLNGVEVFNAAWDLQGALILNDRSFKNNVIFPIQNWNLKSVTNNSFSVHEFYVYKMNNFQKIYLWNYFTKDFTELSFANSKLLVDQVYKQKQNRDCSLGINYNLMANKYRKYFYNMLY
jgi:hypothetical protein